MRNLLHKLRRAAGIRQKEIASHWRVDVSTVRRWEIAPTPPPVAVDALRFHMTEKKRRAEETPGAV